MPEWNHREEYASWDWTERGGYAAVVRRSDGHSWGARWFLVRLSPEGNPWDQTELFSNDRDYLRDSEAREDAYAALVEFVAEKTFEKFWELLVELGKIASVSRSLCLKLACAWCPVHEVLYIDSEGCEGCWTGRKFPAPNSEEERAEGA